jgi:hypothetical protein
MGAERKRAISNYRREHIMPKPKPPIFKSIAALGVLAALGGSAIAQTAMPPQSSGRFTMHPADGGMLRLDTETGSMSMCKAQTGGQGTGQGTGQWTCQSLPDERAALDKEIGRLAQENKDLQGAVKRLEDLAGIPQDKPNGNRRAEAPRFPTDKLPTPDDVDKAMSYFQSMLKKFKEKLKDIEDLDGRRTERL